MNGSTTSNSFGNRPRVDIAAGIANAREVLDQLRSPGRQRPDVRPARDDVRASVLTVLAERPATGYQIVRALQERGNDDRTPGAGAVYPTLQLLADEGLVTAAETDGSRTWTLTTAGHAAAEAVRNRPAAEQPAGTRGTGRRGAIARSAGQLAQATALAAQTGTAGQHAEVAAALDDARRSILAILARS